MKENKISDSENILNYRISTLKITECIRLITGWIEKGEKNRYFVCANPHSLEIAEKDPFFKTALKEADLITPDGSGIVLASKILGGNIRSRVTGSGVFRELSKELNSIGGYKYFFLGSTEENLSLIRNNLRIDYPDIELAGTYSPPFKPEFSEEDNDKMIKAVNDSGANILWVGMTAPKQEKWVFQNRDKLNVNFIGPVGAVFDFYVGNIKRSSNFFLKYGLEWLPRLFQEPRRLWRRMFVSAPKFVFRVLLQKIF